ncbi:MAG: hypothetical protein AAGI30_06110 [Planctomycetota bacterium]
MMLAWTPVVEPLALDGPWWWVTALPLCVLIALGYKSVRGGARRRSPRAVFVMAAQLVLMLGLLTLGTSLLSLITAW